MIIQKRAYIPPLPKKKRVAAYARVSSGKDAMLHSLSAQVSYYSEYIQKHTDWLYCGVYVDEAVTGTKAERENFQRLLRDCRSGKIEIFLRTLIQYLAHGSAENGLKQRLSADLDGLPKALFFWGFEVEE